jgi:hypothetical protein
MLRATINPRMAPAWPAGGGKNRNAASAGNQLQAAPQSNVAANIIKISAADGPCLRARSTVHPIEKTVMGIMISVAKTIIEIAVTVFASKLFLLLYDDHNIKKSSTNWKGHLYGALQKEPS